MQPAKSTSKSTNKSKSTEKSKKDKKPNTTEVYASHLVNKEVLAQHGTDVGKVDEVIVDTDTWKVKALQVNLDRSVLTELNIKQPGLFSRQSVRMSVDHISGISDAIVLKDPIEKISFDPKD